MPALSACTSAEEAAAAGRDMAGKTVVITGGAAGIGAETARVLAHRGARVVIGCRNVAAGQAVADTAKAEGAKGTIAVRPLDLADLASVASFASGVAADEPRVDVLLNNAGVMACPELRTTDGFEMQWGTNHAGHWLLTERLRPKLEACPAPPARVVCVASLAHTTPASLDVADLNWRARPYDRIKAYGASKLANVLHAKGLAARADPSKVLTFSLHPGVIQTDLFRHVGGQPGTWAGSALAAVGGAVRTVGSAILGRPLMKTVPQGAATSVFAVTSPTLGPAQNGFYLADCAPCVPSAAGRSGTLADALWAATEKEVGEALKKRGIK